MKKKKQYLDLEENRYGLFVSQESIDLDVELGRNFLKTDYPNFVYVIKPNVIESKTNSIYNQTKPKDKKFFPPVKIYCYSIVNPPEQKNYGDNKSGIRRFETGKIELTIFLKELEENNLTIQYGDFIQYNMSGEKNRYFEVENAMDIVDETSQTWGAMVPIVKKVIAHPIHEDTVPFLHETD